MQNMMWIDAPQASGGRSLAMAYVPMQQTLEAFSPALALRRGTLFTALYKPFTGVRQVTGR